MSLNKRTNNYLLEKIEELGYYLNQYHPKKSSNIQNFLKDLKNIEPNLSIIAILNNLVQMHKEGFKSEEIIQDIKKTKRIFLIIDEYIKFLEQDSKIKILSKQIHTIIQTHLESALDLFLKEFDLQKTKKI